MKKFAGLLTISLLLISCGGGSSPFTPIKKPVSIALSTEDTLFDGQTTNFAYVADQFTQSVVVLDTRREKIVDTADDDGFDFSPIPIGGEPSAVVVDNGVTPHRIFVSDQFNNQIIAYQIAASLPTSIASYKPVSLGGVLEGKSSRYLFKNSGAASSPTITNIKVDPANAKNESWKLTYKGDGEYEVEGTVSGVQSKRAVEEKKYTSDNGQFEFFISASGEKTTNGDEFFFSTFTTRPLQLTSSPVDLLVHNRNLYILTKNAPSIVVFDLDTLTVTSTTPIPDPTAIPTHMFYSGGNIFVSNIASGDIYSFGTGSLTFSTISTSLSDVQYVGAKGNYLFLVPNTKAKIYTSTLGGNLLKSFNLDDFGNFFFTASVDGKTLGLVPNVSGNVDVIDVDNQKRIDTDLNDKPDFLNPEFFDVPPVSKPQLISVNGAGGKTKNETWQMVFDESAGSYIVTGSKSGLQTNRAVPGEAYTSDHGEISLRTRPSFGFPETEGDFFSFQTFDSIDPILISNQSMAMGGISFHKISDGKPVCYIIQQTNGQVSIVDLTDYKVKKTL